MNATLSLKVDCIVGNQISHPRKQRRFLFTKLRNKFPRLLIPDFGLKIESVENPRKWEK